MITIKRYLLHYSLLEKLLHGVCVLSVVVGIIARIHYLTQPDFQLLEEGFFTGAARGYAQSHWVYQDHPPLGMFIISATMTLLGDTVLGWRLAPLIAGILLIAMTFFLARRLYNSLNAGMIAAALISLDGLFFVYSKQALIDGIIILFIAVLLLAVLTLKRSWLVTIITGLSLGALVSLKWFGSFIIPPMLVGLYEQKRLKFRILLPIFLIAFFVYVGILYDARIVVNLPNPIQDMWNWTKFAWNFHSNAQIGQGARWWTWPIMLEPYYLWHHIRGDKVYATILLANPIIIYGSSTALIVGVVDWVAKRKIRIPLILISGWLAYYLPWVVYIKRLSFIYHYLPAYFFAILILAGCLASCRKKWIVVPILFCSLSLGMFFYFLPVWTNTELTPAQFSHRMWLHSWLPTSNN